MNDHDKKQYRADLKYVFDTFGAEGQLNKLAEECNEVIQAIDEAKAAYKTNPSAGYPVNHLIEEMADVQVITDGICQNLGLTAAIERVKLFKASRTVSRIKLNYYKK